MIRPYLLLTLAVFLSLSVRHTFGNDDRPNIVFIFADDQCFDTIHQSGNSEIQTPNLDELARRGTTFSHAFNMGSWSGAVCVASRTMLNTGRFVWNANAVHAKSEQERQQGRWWSEYMKRAGYRTYMTGKWHCKASAEKAFDIARDIRPGMPKATEAGYNRPAADGTDPWSPSDPKFGGFWEGGTHWSEVVANNAQDFMKDAAGNDSPFFMYLAFNAPHDPRQSPAEYVARYPKDSILIPDNFLPRYPFANQIGCGPGLRDERIAAFPRTPDAIQVHRQEYYAIITHMDEMIGRILKALEASGKRENTWIFFTADHGLAVGQHGLLENKICMTTACVFRSLLLALGLPRQRKLPSRSIFRTSCQPPWNSQESNGPNTSSSTVYCLCLMVPRVPTQVSTVATFRNREAFERTGTN